MNAFAYYGIAIALGGIGLTAIFIVLFAAFKLEYSKPFILQATPTPQDIESPTEEIHLVRRHNHPTAVYSLPVMSQADEQTAEFLKIVRANHWASFNEQWMDSQHPVDAPVVGKRSAHNPHRTIVADDWMPPVGDRRIALTMNDTIVMEKFELTNA